MKQFENEVEIPDWTSTPLKKNKRIKALVEARQEAAAVITEKEKEKRELSAEIQTSMAAAGLDRVRIDDYAVTVVTTERTALNEGVLKKELLEGGMSLSAIEKLWKKCSTVARTSYVKVTERRAS